MLILADMPLKSFLRLFGAEIPLQVVALGDTLHPSSGYVDEAIVGNVTQVSHLLAHPYDFAGLVHFEAVVPELLITYQQQRYTIAGIAKPLARLAQRLRTLNREADEPQFVILTA